MGKVYLDLTQLLEDRDKLLKAHDRLGLAGNNKKVTSIQLSESMKDVESVIETIEHQIGEAVFAYDDLYWIYPKKIILIKNEEVKKIDYEIEGFNKDLNLANCKKRYLFDGIIPRDGHLKFWNKADDIFVQNNVPAKVINEWDICGYPVSDPFKRNYIGPGIYELSPIKAIGILKLTKQL